MNIKDIRDFITTYRILLVEAKAIDGDVDNTSVELVLNQLEDYINIFHEHHKLSINEQMVIAKILVAHHTIESIYCKLVNWILIALPVGRQHYGLNGSLIDVYDLKTPLIDLYNKSILNSENFDFIYASFYGSLDYHRSYRRDVLVKMQEAGMLNNESFYFVLKTPIMELRNYFSRIEKEIATTKNKVSFKRLSDFLSLSHIKANLLSTNIELELASISKMIEDISKPDHVLLTDTDKINIIKMFISKQNADKEFVSILEDLLALFYNKQIANSLMALYKQAIFMLEYADKILLHPDIIRLSDALLYLNSHREFNKYFDLVINHPNPNDIIKSLKILKRYMEENGKEASSDGVDRSNDTIRLLIESNLDVILQHPAPEEVSLAVESLAKVKILNQKNIDKILSHSDLENLRSALCFLEAVDELTQDYFDTLISHQNLKIFNEVLSQYEDAGLLGEFAANLLEDAEFYGKPEFATALRDIEEDNLNCIFNMMSILACDDESKIHCLKLVQEYQNLFFDNKVNNVFLQLPDNSLSLARFEAIIRLLGLSTQQSNKSMATLAVIVYMTLALEAEDDQDEIIFTLSRSMIEQQAIFSRPEVFNQLDNRITNQITIPVVTRMIDICNEREVNEEIKVGRIIDYLNRIGVLNQLEERAGNNFDTQSTHYASVHRTSSESAKRLFDRYEKKLNQIGIKAIHNEMISWTDGLPGDEPNTKPIYASAKKAVRLLTSLNFVDEGSQVSIKQLLALAWLAIHDDDIRLNDLPDARMMFTQGLYEIQRGYNIDKRGNDNGDKVDGNICPPGSFNKLIEILQCVHPDACLELNTPKIATRKLCIIIKEQTINYLRNLPKPTTQAELDKFLLLLNEIKTEGLESIWEHIKEFVADKFFAQFGKDLFDDNRQSKKFTSFIETGELYKIQELPPEIEQEARENVEARKKRPAEISSDALQKESQILTSFFTTAQVSSKRRKENEGEENKTERPSP